MIHPVSNQHAKAAAPALQPTSAPDAAPKAATARLAADKSEAASRDMSVPQAVDLQEIQLPASGEYVAENGNTQTTQGSGTWSTQTKTGFPSTTKKGSA